MSIVGAEHVLLGDLDPGGPVVARLQGGRCRGEDQLVRLLAAYRRGRRDLHR